MVAVPPPPPPRPPNPLYRDLVAGTHLVRLFNPASHAATQLSFRTYRPLARFDHQRPAGRRGAGEDPDRGIYYAAFALSSCIVEVFGDTGVIEPDTWQVARVQLRQPLHLLDLTGPGAMRAGSVAALAKVPQRLLTQKWSRFFYDTETLYSAIDGLVFSNAHNDEEALALYERAAPKLECPDSAVVRLGHPGLSPYLRETALTNNLIFDPL